VANTQAMCNSFKTEILRAMHDFTASTGHTFKIALFTSSATLNKSTTAYGTSNEVTGTNYTAGGVALTSVTPALSTDTACCDFADASWASATISGINAALIYNSSASDKAVSVHTFSPDQSVVAGTLTLVFPAADASNAIIRIA
jgi:hypothetical protein